MEDYKYKYLFGPVPSRRLGLSLGIDIVPLKSCSQDCVYCQLGKRDDLTTIDRRSFVDIDKVIEEIQMKIRAGLEADFLTISGSGEPTLNSDIGILIGRIKELTDIPVAVITNGTLLYQRQVREDIFGANVVIPSLDAFDQESFDRINRPHKDITFEKLFDGLKIFGGEFSGRIYLEVFLLDGMNSSDEDVKKLRELISQIKAEKVQLNTAVRPTAEMGLRPVSRERLEEIAKMLGDNVEVIVDFDKLKKVVDSMDNAVGTVYDMIKRRPCSIDDIVASLGVNRNEVLKAVTILLNDGKIIAEPVGGRTYYKAV